MSNIEEIKKLVTEVADHNKLGKIIDIFDALDALENKAIEKRISNADMRFTSALATLSVIQNNFTGECDAPNDEIIYYSIESARNEIKAAYKILTDGTYYGGYKGDYPFVV